MLYIQIFLEGWGEGAAFEMDYILGYSICAQIGICSVTCQTIRLIKA